MQSPTGTSFLLVHLVLLLLLRGRPVLPPLHSSTFMQDESIPKQVLLSFSHKKEGSDSVLVRLEGEPDLKATDFKFLPSELQTVFKSKHPHLFFACKGPVYGTQIAPQVQLRFHNVGLAELKLDPLSLPPVEGKSNVSRGWKHFVFHDKEKSLHLELEVQWNLTNGLYPFQIVHAFVSTPDVEDE